MKYKRIYTKVKYVLSAKGQAMLKHGILGLLNYGDMTGYEIREIFNKSLNFFWQAQSSQIYRELHTLEKNGWITMTTVLQSDKPNKNICSITESGKTELMRWICSDNAVMETRLPVLMQVFFLGNRSREENILYFERLIETCSKWMDSFSGADKTIDHYAKEYGTGDHGLYWKMTVDFGRRSLQTYIDWAKHCMEELENAE